jgi:nucleotide-binding universal stress UspA family protein
MFRRILVAIDGSDAARSAFVFVTDWARQFDAQVWFIVLTEESSRRRCELVTDVSERGRQLANSFTVSGATRGARNQQLVSAVADAAKAYKADLIVLGFDPRRVAHQRFTRGVREQLTAATDLPVLVAPRQCAPTRVAARAEAHPRPQPRIQQPIALGPVREPAGVAAAGVAAGVAAAGAARYAGV